MERQSLKDEPAQETWQEKSISYSFCHFYNLKHFRNPSSSQNPVASHTAKRFL
jgi:hypothetical protein